MEPSLSVSVKNYSQGAFQMEESQSYFLKYLLDTACQQNSLKPENIWSLFIVEHDK